MYRYSFKLLLVLLSFVAFTNYAEAQKAKPKKKAVQRDCLCVWIEKGDYPLFFIS
jgi:hypothetical protein